MGRLCRERATGTALLTGIVIGFGWTACAQAGQLPNAPSGQVRFYPIADADFDVYTRSPTTTQQQWMRSHYARMQTYTPYFDTRLSWYPNGWAYKDSFGVRPGSTIAVQHPDWLLRDMNGNVLYIDWACSGGTCPQYAADFGNPNFRNYWLNEARQIIAKGYKGLWVDDVNMTFRTSDGYGNSVIPRDPRTGLAMTLSNWRRYMAEFMEQLRAAVPTAEIAHNAIWYAGPTNDAYVLRQIDAADYINLERGVYDRGLVYGSGQWGFETFLGFIDFVHGRNRSIVMMDYGTTTTDREFGVAGYLLVNEGRDLHSSDQVAWTAPDTWWTGYDTNLSESVGRRYKWQNLLRRDFQCGMVLANQPGAPTVTASLGGSYRTLSGSTVTSVTLAARQARVLLGECDTALDTDLDNSGSTTVADYNLLRSVLNQPASSSSLAAAADLDGSGWVTAADYNLLRDQLNSVSP